MHTYCIISCGRRTPKKSLAGGAFFARKETIFRTGRGHVFVAGSRVRPSRSTMGWASVHRTDKKKVAITAAAAPAALLLSRREVFERRAPTGLRTINRLAQMARRVSRKLIWRRAEDRKEDLHLRFGPRKKQRASPVRDSRAVGTVRPLAVCTDRERSRCPGKA